MKRPRPSVDEVVRLLEEYGPLVNTSIAAYLRASDGAVWHVLDEGIRARRIKAVTFRREERAPFGTRSRVIVYGIAGTEVEKMRLALTALPPPS